MTIDAAWNRGKLIRNLLGWTGDEVVRKTVYESGVADSRAYAEMAERKFSNEQMARAAGYRPQPNSPALDRIGLFVRNRAVARLVQGDVAGWEELSLAVAYEVVADRLQMRIFKRIRQESAGILALQAAWTLAAVLVVGDRPFCRSYVAFLLEANRIGGLQKHEWCLLDWLLSLAAATLDAPAEVKPVSPAMPVEYVTLSKVWNASDPSALSAPLIAAADRHTAQARVSNSRANYDFDDLAYAVFPIELLAVFRLREWLGLRSPAIDHPLFGGLLGQLPPAGAIRPDELLQRVIDKADRIYPDTAS